MLSKNKRVLITFFTLPVGLLSFLLSLNSVLFQDNGLFVIHENKYYNAEEYSIGSSLSSVAAYKFENVNSYGKENDEQFVDSQNSLADFNFALAGDWGCTKNTKKTVKLIQHHDPDIVFSLGDTSYGPDINCWTDIVSPISDKMKVIIGNHDVMSLNLLVQQLKEFGLHKPYYSFDYNNIHFLMMDSESSYLPGADPNFFDLNKTEQYHFVENDLSEISNNPAIKWIIVMNHRQFYSSVCGEHDSCDPIKKLRDAYHPLFQRYGVDVLFSGHAHNYQRTYPLFYNDINSSQPIIEQNGKTEYKSPKGMFQIIAGTGGIDLDPLSNQEPYVVYQQDASYGFLNIDVIDQGNVLIGKYYANDDDEIVDEFKIIK
jgi:predicted phosphodiesterase